MTNNIASSVFGIDLGKELPKKTVYLLVVDLVNSTHFKLEADTVNWQDTYTLGFSEVAKVVAQLNGKIVKFLGDGFLFVFEDKKGEDPAEDSVRAAIEIQRHLEVLRKGDLSPKFHVRVSVVAARAHPISLKHTMISGDVFDQTIDFLGPDVDLVFRLNDAISPDGIISNKRLIDNVRWGPLTEEYAPDEEGEIKKFLGKISVKGLGPVEAHEISWSGRFVGVKGAANAQDTDKSEPKKPNLMDILNRPTANFVGGGQPTGQGAYVNKVAAVQQTRIGHVYSITASQTNFWIEEHHKDAAQHIGVTPNIVRRDIPLLNEVVLFVRRPGTPHPKAVQILRDGTEFVGKVVTTDRGEAMVKIDEYAANAHDMIRCVGEVADDLKPGESVKFTLSIGQDGDGLFKATGVDLKKIG